MDCASVIRRRFLRIQCIDSDLHKSKIDVDFEFRKQRYVVSKSFLMSNNFSRGRNRNVPNNFQLIKELIKANLSDSTRRISTEEA